MQQEFVERRQWLTKAEFLDLLGASNLIPGPSSTELAIHIGYRQAKGWGLLIAGVCFILPAFLLVMGIAAVYRRFGTLPQVGGALYGMKAVVIAVILQALWKLMGTAVPTWRLTLIGLLAAGGMFFRLSPLLILFGAGATNAAVQGFKDRTRAGIAPLAALIGLIAALVALPLLLNRTMGTGAISSPALFLVFLKLGSIVYGSGYVLLAFLQSELVTRLHWLSAAQILDATAVGQITPGPVFTTATFLGYLLGGPTGAIVATLGMFLPAFLFVAVSGPLVPRLRKSPVASAFLDGVNAASLALMGGVTWELAVSALHDATTVLLALASAILLFRFRVHSVWLLLGGALLGLLISTLSHPPAR